MYIQYISIYGILVDSSQLDQNKVHFVRRILKKRITGVIDTWEKSNRFWTLFSKDWKRGCIQRKTDQKLALCSDFHLTGIEFFWVLSGISQFNSR